MFCFMIVFCRLTPGLLKLYSREALKWKKELSPFLWNWPIKPHSSTESQNCCCGEVPQRPRCVSVFRKSARPHSSRGAIPGRGQRASVCASNITGETKQLVPCVAWRDSFWHAWRPASSQPKHFKWVISERQLCCAGPQTKPCLSE